MLKVIHFIDNSKSEKQNTIRLLSEIKERFVDCEIIISKATDEENDVSEIHGNGFTEILGCSDLRKLLKKKELFKEDDIIMPVFSGEEFSLDDLEIALREMNNRCACVIAEGKDNRVVTRNLIRKPQSFTTTAGICLVRYNKIAGILFSGIDFSCPDEARGCLLALACCDEKELCVVFTTALVVTADGDSSSLNWYGKKFFTRYDNLGDYCIKKLGEVPLFIQYFMGYQLVRRFRANRGESCSCAEMCKESKKNTFFGNCQKILRYVDNRVFMRLDSAEFMRLPEPVIALLSEFKKGNTDLSFAFNSLRTSDNLYCCIDNYIVTSIESKKAVIRLMDILEDYSVRLYIFTNGVIEKLGCELYLNVDDNELKADIYRFDPLIYFGTTIFNRCIYKVTIPANMVYRGSHVSFFYKENSNTYNLKLDAGKFKEKFADSIEFAPEGFTVTCDHYPYSEAMLPVTEVPARNTASVLVLLSAESSEELRESALNDIKQSELYLQGRITIAVISQKKIDVSIFNDEKILSYTNEELTSLKSFTALLKRCKCSYITHLNATDRTTKYYFDDAVSYASAHNLLSLVPFVTHDEDYLGGDNFCVNLLDEPKFTPTECRSAFYSSFLFIIPGFTEEVWNKVNSIEFDDEKYLALFCALTVHSPKIGIFNQHALITNAPFSTDGVAYSYASQAGWYLPSTEKFFLLIESLYKGSLPRALQYIVLDRILQRLNFNENQHDMHIITEESLPQWKKALHEILQRIDNEVITDLYKSGRFHVKPHFALWLLRIKNEEDFTSSVRLSPRGLTIEACGNALMNTKRQAVQIEVMDYTDTELVLECSSAGFFEMHNVFPQVRFGTEIIPTENSYYYCHRKLFTEEIWKRYTFRVRIPFSLIEEGKALSFFYSVSGYSYPLSIRAIRFPAKLNSFVPGSYWKCKNCLVALNRSKMSISVWPYTAKKARMLEKNLRERCVNEAPYEKLEDIKHLMNIRKKYFRTRFRYASRNIWIAFDKLYKAGDNGEYFFRYAKKQKGGAELHYIVNKGYPDAEKLVKDGIRPLYFKTTKQILHFLNSKVIATTHAGIPTFSGVPSADFRYIQDLFGAEIVCIQHGLAVQWMPHNLYAGYDNTKRFYCATESELNNLNHPMYGYSSNALRLTGLSRYDGLVNRSKKQILISPTWRSYIAMPSSAGNTRPYSETFKGTEYYRIYNGLINNPKFVETAKRCGYRIIYLLHPTLSSQIDDFIPAEGVEVRSPVGESYEKIMTESDLMITDYSGIQFDFAYMRKPIVYYHPDELPPGYSEGGFSYSEQGFGPICKDERNLVDAVCAYMENKCQLDDFYLARQNGFFAYSDHNNCQRIYDEILAFEKQQRGSGREVINSGFNYDITLKARILNNSDKTRLYWNSCSENTGYEILTSDEINGFYKVIATTDDISRNFLVPDELQNNWFKVRAVYLGGEVKGNCSQPVRSGVATDFTEDKKPAPADIIACTTDFNGGVRIFWTGNEKAAFWKIYRRTGETEELLARLSNVSTWEYRDPDGKPELNPLYSIKAVYRKMDNELVASASTTECNVSPRINERIAINCYSEEGTHLSWSYSDTPGEFRLYRRIGERARYELLSEFKAESTFTYVDNCKGCSGRYMLTKNVNGSWAPSVSVKFNSPVQLEKVENLTLHSSSKKEAELTWNRIPDAQKITVYKQNSSEKAMIKVAELKGDAISWTDKSYSKSAGYSIIALIKKKGQTIKIKGEIKA